MKVDERLIRKVATLARLELTPEESKRFTRDIQDILEAFKALDGFDSSGITPSYRPIDEKNALRDDEVMSSISNDDALKSTKNKEDGFFIGPRTVE